MLGDAYRQPLARAFRQGGFEMVAGLGFESVKYINVQPSGDEECESARNS
jgi:hypothetical protein